jgi:hypothetical protein
VYSKGLRVFRWGPLTWALHCRTHLRLPVHRRGLELILILGMMVRAISATVPLCLLLALGCKDPSHRPTVMSSLKNVFEA